MVRVRADDPLEARLADPDLEYALRARRAVAEVVEYRRLEPTRPRVQRSLAESEQRLPLQTSAA
jgi:hypothetical protein